jgi:hypothetical protein
MSQTEIAIFCPDPTNVPEWRPSNRRTKRGDEGRVWITDRRKKRGLDYCDSLLRQIDLEPLASVVQSNSHYLTVSKRSVISM